MPYTLRTSTNPKMGGIIKGRIGNETPSNIKGLPTTSPNGMDKLRAASMWAMRPPRGFKFQRDFDEKIEKYIGVTYSSTVSDTSNKNVRIY